MATAIVFDLRLTPAEVALVCVAAALTLLTGRRVLPALLILIRPARLRSWFVDAEQEAGLLGAVPILDDLLRWMREQRFVLLGVKAEKLPLWGATYQEAALVARDRQAFASIVLTKRGVPSSIYLYTPLAGGGMVFTRDHTAGWQEESDRLSVRNVATENLEELIGQHRERVQAMQARGMSPDVRPTQAGRLQATRDFYASGYFRRVVTAQILPALVSFGLSLVLLAWAVLASLLD